MSKESTRSASKAELVTEQHGVIAVVECNTNSGPDQGNTGLSGLIIKYNNGL